MTSDFAAVHRLIHGEGRRFPELLRLNHDAAVSANGALVAVLRGEMARGTVDVRDAEFAVQCWLHILLGHARQDYDGAGDDAVEHEIERSAGPLTDVFLRIVGYRADAGPTGLGTPA